MKKLPALLFLLAVLAGCKETSEPVQTADWYKSNGKERLEVIAKCKANPGELALTPNCVNAKSAQNQLDFGNHNFGVGASAPTFQKKGN